MSPPSATGVQPNGPTVADSSPSQAQPRASRARVADAPSGEGGRGWRRFGALAAAIAALAILPELAGRLGDLGPTLDHLGQLAAGGDAMDEGAAADEDVAPGLSTPVAA